MNLAALALRTVANEPFHQRINQEPSRSTTPLSARTNVPQVRVTRSSARLPAGYNEAAVFAGLTYVQ
jgi:hypothetical protein